MPHPHWTHTCKKTFRTKRDWKPFRCWRCFGQAEFSGWSNSVVEMMGDYQRVSVGRENALASAAAATPAQASGTEMPGEERLMQLFRAAVARSGAHPG